MNKVIKLYDVLLFILFFIILFFMKNIFSVFLFIPLFILIFFISKDIKIKRFSFFIFIFSFIIRLFSILYLKVSITDDFKTMYVASKSLLRGDFSFLNTFYFKTFSYQLGHVLYQAFFLNIINSVTFLKLINVLISSLIVLFIYLISRNLFNEKIARIVSLTYTFYLYPIYLDSVLTNQHLPALIVLIVIYLLIKKEINYKLVIIIGILLGIANIFRTESIIIIMGIIIYFICNNTSYKNTFIKICLLLVSYFIFNLGINGIIYLSLGTTLSNNAPSWKFYCGLNYKYNGIYNTEDQNVYFNSKNKDKNKLVLDRIKEENIKLPVLFLKKEVILWSQTNYDLRINNKINPSIYNFLLYFNQGCLNLIIILFIISLFPKNKYNDKLLLIKIIIGLYYFIYMFIEISPRYSYILHILIMLEIGISIDKILKIKQVD